jgi:two-component system phosphate regulon sensor histidine kinase PhoR
MIVASIISHYLNKKKHVTINEKRINNQHVIETIIDNFRNACVILTKDGRIVSYNKAFYDLVGPSHINSFVKDSSYITNFINGGHQNRLIESLINDHYYYIELTKLITEGLDLVFMNFVDVTLIKNAYLKQDSFIKDLKHELKTPLSGIIGLSNLLTTIPIDDEKEFNKICMTIHEEALRVNDIINELTNSFDSNVGTDIIDIDNLFDELSLIYQNNEHPNVRLYFRNYVEINLVSDFQIIKQIIINIINNAFQYTVAGYINVKAVQEDNSIVFSISDTGIGMDTAEIDLIFERFYRIDKSRDRHTGGYGLGLSIVKKLVDKLGATINVMSKVNVGTTFIIKFALDKEIEDH